MHGVPLPLPKQSRPLNRTNMPSSTTPKPHDSQAWLQHSDPELRIFYTECLPTSSPKPKGTILLIHGFPETSHQFRHVLVPLADAGYGVLAPDYRGHGYSSKPPNGYTKAIIAQDLHKLVTEHLGIKEKIHVVGHDIGGMIAHAYAAQFPAHVASICWGECPLPGTRLYEDVKHTSLVWHFNFQAQTDMAVALTTGKERMYLKHFFDRLATNQAAFTEKDLDFYTAQYAQAGALRAAFTTYRMFEEDARQNRKWLEESGKVQVRCMGLFCENLFEAARAQEMVSEVYENVEMGVMKDCGHYLAEEDPESFVKLVLGFVEK